MVTRGCGSSITGNIAKMCMCLSTMLLLLSSTDNSFVAPLPAKETYQAKRASRPSKSEVRRMMIFRQPIHGSSRVNRSRSGRGGTMSAKP
ncbi:hypothetical protein HA466_0089690 [Hirschfeldia incana]|nr:hypothetical protein HA466_0089690 [Hirschfeldia incana]